MRIARATAVLLLVSLGVTPAGQGIAEEPQSAAPRSDGQVLPAFARDEAEAISDDGIRQRASWKGSPPLPDQTVRLRFHVDGAALYAFWVE